MVFGFGRSPKEKRSNMIISMIFGVFSIVFFTMAVIEIRKLVAEVRRNRARQPNRKESNHV